MILCYSDTLPYMNYVIPMTPYTLHFKCYKVLRTTAIYSLFHFIYACLLALFCLAQLY